MNFSTSKPLLFPRRIAAIVPRFGPSLGGGAEALVRALVLHLRDQPSVQTVEVWTTCAEDHRTWHNSLPAGTSMEDGIVVRRFPVDERDVEVFLDAELAMRDGLPLSIEEQLGWLTHSVNS
ncbi:MAG: hypothetical protein KDD44_09735, partial [Bdellovibrionales bacterium]|nr:hypothetical protein [Bdellovibrionales bacterium]